ncbi:nitroreductase family protein [Paecilomyces variotii No. 5]|uniref:Nitroreductase family protein n=1 Tax=Byssochlamys spectabilis (strain No. 5 / NBRC 109023) TaxID=1356009 RepID=V5FWK7_BYSSN|nr:nitroreductase family protein [Paecilomyces variotii No. 5]
MADAFLSSFAARRSVYQLSGESPIPDEQLEEIVQKVLLATPSAFNTQSTRILILKGAQHHKLWDIVKAAVAPFVTGEQATATNKKLAGFKGAYATILFFEDPSTYEPLAAFKLYSDKFESWRDQANGMHQLLVWTALSLEGLGGNLQHYNPLIDDEVKKTWSVNSDWKLLAQLVIGKPVGDAPAPKEKKAVADRYRVIS